MARIKSGGSNAISGMVGPVVFVQRGNSTFVRRAPQFSGNSWSPRQKQHRERFKKMADFCREYKFSVIFPIWRKVSATQIGYNLFLKANAPAFGLDGELADLSLLRFSDGSLPVPFQIGAEQQPGDPAKIAVSWVNDPMLSPQFKQDELMMMVAHAGQFSGPYATGIRRMEQQGVIALPEGLQQIEGIYLFFGSPDREAFSPDHYCPLSVEVNP